MKGTVTPRTAIGLGIGALAGVGALTLEQRHLYLMVIVLALATGVVAGLSVGWRAAPPSSAAHDALVIGALATALLAVGALAGGALSAHLRLAAALVSLALCMGATVAFAVLISAWTGYHPNHAGKGSAPAADHAPEPAPQRAGSLPTTA